MSSIRTHAFVNELYVVDVNFLQSVRLTDELQVGFRRKINSNV